MRAHTLVGLVAILVAAAVGGCSATAPNPSPTPFLSASAVAPSIAAGGSGPRCATDQLSARTGDWGPAAGTTYVLIHVSLASGAPCALPAYPAVDLVDAAGAVI